MSTKSSLAYEQDKFHFWVECMSDDFAYLEQRGIEFEVDNHKIMVSIPAEVMDKIAKKWLKHRKNNVP